MTTEQILEVLASTPGRLAAITAGATAADLRRPQKPREWSMTELLAHLRACADVWGGAILTILDDEDATIRAINPTTWIKGTDYPTLEFGASLSAFRRQRARLLSVLGGLDETAWQRRATVVGAGAPLTDLDPGLRGPDGTPRARPLASGRGNHCSGPTLTRTRVCGPVPMSDCSDPHDHDEPIART